MKERSLITSNLDRRGSNNSASKMRTAGSVLIWALTVSAGAGFSAATASAAILYVGDCQSGSYSTIQAAVEAAAAGDTVRVCPGEYAEEVVINKNLTLAGIVKDERDVPTIVYPAKTDRPLCTAADEGLCPQILVESATATITGLRIDDSAFPQNTCVGGPAGIAFIDAEGTVSSNTIVNQNAFCESEGEFGYPIVAGYTTEALTTDYSVNVLNNTISNFGSTGITYEAYYAPDALVTLTGTISGNSFTPMEATTISVSLDGVDRAKVTNNKITGNSAADGSLAIAVSNSVKPSITDNTITDSANGISVEDAGSATVDGNSLSSVTQSGFFLACVDKSSVSSNKVIDSPANATAIGVDIYDCNFIQANENVGSDKNSIVNNKFSGLCTGILTGSSLNIDNLFQPNSFSDIGPGQDVMAGNSCP